MNTTATNRKIRVLMTGIRDEKLIPRPEFQRRLVWSNKDKLSFLTTVLQGYPFPEIYIAAGEVDPDTGDGTEMLVDGQQRITTLHQYFTGSQEIRLGDMPPYAALAEADKLQFLEYEVVVRDLGQKSIDEIKEIFSRINSTKYSLNAMEIHNARYQGELKQFGEEISQIQFFDRHRVFLASEIRRMDDVMFSLLVVVTMMSTYFNRNSEIETYLAQYNDEFPQRDELWREINDVLAFVDQCNFTSPRTWKKADLFTLLVELHRLIFRDNAQLDPNQVRERVEALYQLVDGDGAHADATRYRATIRASSTDRAARIIRGEVLKKAILGQLQANA